MFCGPRVNSEYFVDLWLNVCFVDLGLTLDVL